MGTAVMKHTLPNRANLSRFAKLAVTAGLLYWLLAAVDTDKVLDALSAIDAQEIALGVALCSAAFLLGALRWWLLLRHVEKNAAFLATLPSYYVGILFNNLLPSSMGGDVVRTMHLALRGFDARVLAGSAVVDRVVGLAVTLVVGALSLSFSEELASSFNERWAIGLLVVAITLGAFIGFSDGFRNLIQRLADRYRNTTVRSFLLETLWICHSYRSGLQRILIAGVLTFVVQSCVILVYYLLGRELNLSLSLWTYFAIVPVVFVAASIPISLGGLGVREGALVICLTAAGADAHDAAALSFAFLVVLWLASLPGLAALLITRRITRLQTRSQV